MPVVAITGSNEPFPVADLALRLSSILIEKRRSVEATGALRQEVPANDLKPLGGVHEELIGA